MGGGCIDVREELCNGFSDAVGAAESANHSRLGCRVFLLGSVALYDAESPAVHWPLGHVTPVIVCSQQVLNIGGISFSDLIYILTVPGAAGPVHQSAGLVGGAVEDIDVYPVCDAAGDGDVFVRSDLPAQGDNEPEARRLRGVAVCRVEAPCRSCQDVRYDGRSVALTVVYVERHEAPADDAVAFAAAVFESASDEASDVLHLPFLGAGHQAVVGHALTGLLAVLEPPHQVLPGGLFVHPGGLGA